MQKIGMADLGAPAPSKSHATVANPRKIFRVPLKGFGAPLGFIYGRIESWYDE